MGFYWSYTLLIKPLLCALLPENITSLLPSVLLRVCNTNNNANGNKRSGIAWYHGDNDFSYEPLISLCVQTQCK